MRERESGPRFAVSQEMQYLTRCNRLAHTWQCEIEKSAFGVVAVMGIDDTQEHETGTRSIVHLPGVQLELLKALKAASTKLVLVLVGGSAMAVLVALDVKVLFILPSILCMVIPNEAYRAA